MGAKMPKIAVTGKGGVGKTTLASLLAFAHAARGYQVLAVDVDPSPCLADALGFPAELTADLVPIAQMEELIYERTGAKPGTTGGFFKLNPRVDDLPERFSVVHRGIRLLELGAVELGGSGCICPESAMLKTLITHLIFYRDDLLIMDMYAGVEHLGRATAGMVDAMIIVAEPGRRSLGTAGQIAKLAQDIGIKKLYLVGNKMRNEDDVAFMTDHSPGLPVLGALLASPAAIQADLDGIPVYDAVPELASAAREMLEVLEREYEG
jgi:CO dehydrogenase maturation factor